MKIFGFGAMIIAAIAVAAVHYHRVQNSPIHQLDLALENIEAVAQGEGGGATYVESCYLDGFSNIWNSGKQYRKCASGTSANVFYPCSRASWEKGEPSGFPYYCVLD